ncbi:MAG: valine--tRNA ligase, partial [Tunicatimonas sp.]|uniref:valine--tRNA ligase n=1 Tax=Tunicatimonas sp. TaxID=1940096 RepID=UPI003C712967
MALSSKYNPREVEDKWYQQWLDKKFFHSEPHPDKESYTIVIPPPNVTGVLHMGHMLNNTIQDVLIRKARMEGKAACWVPGYDHASIATEAKVVAMLKERGINKHDLSREKFLEYAWEWKEKYGGIILEQLKKLGASCDWDRTSFTMDDHMTESVIKVFVDLHNKGHIYRGYRMINWDPQAKTSLSDEEVLYKEVQSKLYYVNYPIEGEDGYVTIATTRPETILGDTAVCVNPNDERYQHLRGKRVLVPLIDRSIPIIEDEYVTMEFGTGCLKVTPAHDMNDYELGKKHELDTIDVIADDGTMSAAAQLFVGEDRFVVRKKIGEQLEAEGFIHKIEDYQNKVGVSERTSAVIEPKLSVQWFVRMDELVKPALANVLNDNVQFYPAKFKNMYRTWMENIQNWNISRQLWWGQRIPAYYLPEGEIVVAETAEEALKLAQEKSGNASLSMDDLKQDEDVLDTWFSSGLWPITVFDGIRHPDNAEINFYYPTNVLVTAPEIIFFWVARMI